jgi:hypothetical protein
MRPLLSLPVLVVLLAPSISHAQTQDWSAVQALPRETRVIVRELGGHGRHVGHIRGRLLLVKDSEITVLRSGQPLVIPRTEIGRIDKVRRDPVWEGMIIGVLYALIMRATFAAEATAGDREPRSTIASAAIAGGVGALIDFTNDEERVVYKAPKGTITILRLSF